MLRVGLTGAVAAGKSTVAQLLREEGFPVLDADGIVHKLYREDRELTAAVAEAFPGVENAQGEIDRRALGRRVFGHPRALQRLEAIVHPRVMEYISRWFDRQDQAEVAVVEAALWHRLEARRSLDVLITVLAGEDVRAERLKARGLSDSEAEVRLRAQGPMPTGEDERHWVVSNDGSLRDLESAVRDVAGRLRRRVGTQHREEGPRDGSTGN